MLQGHHAGWFCKENHELRTTGVNEVNREILEKLGLEIDLNTAATEEILEALEDKQLELEERLEQVEDAARKRLCRNKRHRLSNR